MVAVDCHQHRQHLSFPHFARSHFGTCANVHGIFRQFHHHVRPLGKRSPPKRTGRSLITISRSTTRKPQQKKCWGFQEPKTKIYETFSLLVGEPTHEVIMIRTETKVQLLSKQKVNFDLKNSSFTGYISRSNNTLQ